MSADAKPVPPWDGPLLMIEGLRVSYRGGPSTHLAVDDISLVLERGRTLCLVGESGAGKSSVALAIPRLLPPTAEVRGRILFQGNDVLTSARKELYELRRRHISVVFQDAVGSLVPSTRVGVQLKRALEHRLRIRDPQGLAAKSRGLLAAVGLGDLDRVAAAFPRELSGGMCQRVMLALALSAEPSLLIADEPLSSLDAITQTRVLELLFSLQKQHGFGMLYVTHDLRVAARFDDVGVLRQGRLVEFGPCTAVLTQPTTEYTRDLLVAVRGLGGTQPS